MSKPARRAWPVGALAVTLLLAGGVAIALWRPRALPPPAVDTTGLEPAVTQLIQSALQDVRATPRSAAAWGRLGSVLMQCEFADETAAAFTRAEQLAPQDPRWPYLHGLAIGSGDVLAATEKFQRATALAPGQSDAPRLRLAQNLAERGLNEEAARHFETLLKKTPAHPVARLGLARVRHGQERITEATNLLAAALRDPHTRRAAHALLAMMEQSRGRTTAAELAARTSASLPPDAVWPDPWWDEARKNRAGQKSLLEEATSLIDRAAWSEAEAVLGQMLRAYPQDAEAWYLMGWTFNQQQRGADAERALREYHRLAPQSPKGHAQLAVALLTQRRYAEAIEVLQAGVKLKPTWRELHSNLGYACVQLGRGQEAAGHYRAALALDPNHAPSHAALAELLLRRGEKDEARQLLRRALEVDPGHRRARALLDQLESAR